MGSEIIVREFKGGFEANGVKFKEVTGNYDNYKTTAEEIVILKGPDFLRSYNSAFANAPKRSVLEFGVFEGGSIIFFALANPTFRFVGIDIRDPDPSVLDHIKKLGLSDRVTIYYNTSQSDAERINRIICDEFGNDGLGIIIDDASHSYTLSKKTFELTFGRLANGGMYCLEDWAWAHWGEPFQTKKWIDKPALTNLVFEVVMLFPSTQGIVDHIEIFPGAVHIRRGSRSVGTLSLEDLIKARGKLMVRI